jgi:hypothetical protein
LNDDDVGESVKSLKRKQKCGKNSIFQVIVQFHDQKLQTIGITSTAFPLCIFYFYTSIWSSSLVHHPDRWSLVREDFGSSGQEPNPPSFALVGHMK